MHLDLQAGDRIRSLNAWCEGDRWRLEADGAALPVAVLAVDGGTVDLKVEGVRTRCWVARRGADRLVFLDGVVHTLRLPDDDAEFDDDLGDRGPNLTARMPGTVVKVLVAEGDRVAAGDPLVIMEAMKMETEIAAPVDGAVAVVYVAAGQVLAAGDPLLDLDPDGED